MRKDAAVWGRLAVGFRLRVLMTSTQPSAVAREHSRAFERSVTPGVHALHPKRQRSQWAAIDTDYENSLEDLLKLQWWLRRDGVEQRSKSPAALLTLGLRGQTIAWKAWDRPEALVGTIWDVPFSDRPGAGVARSTRRCSACRPMHLMEFWACKA
jgi:hypothetical protein